MPRLCSGQMLRAFGLTEPEAGSDAGNTQTRARLDGDEWVINGSKQFITNAGTDISGLVVITVVTSADGERRREISNIVVHAKLANIATEIESCRLLVQKAAWLKDRGQNHR